MKPFGGNFVSINNSVAYLQHPLEIHVVSLEVFIGYCLKYMFFFYSLFIIKVGNCPAYLQYLVKGACRQVQAPDDVSQESFRLTGKAAEFSQFSRQHGAVAPGGAFFKPVFLPFPGF